MSDVTMGFWDQFFPGFLATLVGVALGIPTGLSIERRSHRQAARREQQDAEARLKNALAIVRESIERNHEALEKLSTVVETGWVRPDTDLGVASWIAVQKEVLSGLTERPELRASLASFFEGIERLIALHRFLVEQNVGVNLAIPKSKEVVAQVMTEVQRRCALLLEEARQLATELR